MKWLHISDIHMGRGAPGDAQDVALSSLTDAVDRATDGMTLDALLITGDIAHAGLRVQYDNFAAGHLARLRALRSLARSVVVAVPGNHDLDCDVGLPIGWDNLGQARQSEFFSETAKGRALRSSRAAAFAAYIEFCVTNKILTLESYEDISKVVRIPTAGGSVNAILLNTALLCDRDLKNDDGVSPAPLPALTHRLQSLRDGGGLATLVLGHHPIRWFLFSQREPFKSALVERKALYLHGHTHRVESECSTTGLLSLGFGAAYQGTAFAGPTSFYRNTFSICDFDTATLDLDVLAYGWSVENGRWVKQEDLPADFHVTSTRLNGGHRFRTIGSPKSEQPAGQGSVRLASLRPASLFLVGRPSEDSWRVLLDICGLVPMGTALTPGSPTEDVNYYDYVDGAGRHRIRVISASGHVLSEGEIERLNTTLDSEGLASMKVISVGGMAADARTLYLQLRGKKNIEIVHGQDVCTRAYETMHAPVKELLAQLSEADATADIFVLDRRKYLLIRDRVLDDWFYVVDETGAVLYEASEPVQLLRRFRGALTNRRYGGPLAAPGAVASIRPEHPPFAPEEYRRACFADANAIRYAGLATIGIRAPRIQLDQLYVQTRAETGTGSDRLGDFDQAISDFVQSLSISESLKAEVEQELRKRYADGGTAETGYARQFYQRYGSVLALGDPGSGKTCFVKSEILEYCAPSSRDGSWYSNHIPVYVPLAEASASLQGDPSLLVACSQSATRRGLVLPIDSLQSLFDEGRLAFFFDGLDEVGSLEQRTRVVAALRELVDQGRPLGNRYVLTSRPAAVQSIEMPDSLSPLSLSGLSTDEMKTLARRVLALRLSSTGGETKIDLSKLTPEEEELVDKILEDCRSQRGIGRLGSNPLLLTLLVMTYQSSGKLFARRHRVYAAAIQTLVSVRNRDERIQTISEVDLKKRLGAVALTMIRQPHGPILSIASAAGLIQEIMVAERVAPVGTNEALQFLQDVAERTGLVVLHGSVGDASSTLTFMHYSFAEYYAAVGLLQSRATDEIVALSPDPHWRDVLTLLAGINGDVADPHELIDGILRRDDPIGRVTLGHLVLALDCAIECDVPSERTLTALVDETKRHLRGGALEVDAGVRTKVGERLGRLLSNSASPILNRFFLDALADQDETYVAATVDLLAHASTVVPVSDELLTLYDRVMLSHSKNIQLSVLHAAVIAGQLRRPGVRSVIDACRDGDAYHRLVSASALVAIPAIAKASWREVHARLSVEPALIATTLARALLKAGLQYDGDSHGREVFLDALARVEDYDTSAQRIELEIPIDRTAVDAMLTSTDKKEKLVGIRLLPWLQREEEFIKERFLSLLGSEKLPHDERAASLAALRLCTSVLPLFTETEWSDLYVRGVSAKERDVRMATYKLIATGPRRSQGRESLLKRLEVLDVGDGEEWRVLVRTLSRCAEGDARVARVLVDILRAARKMPHKQGRQVPVESRISALRGIEESRAEVDAAGARVLEDIVRDYRASPRERRAALLAFSSSCVPNEGTARFLVEEIQQERPDFSSVVGRVGHNFIRNARRTLDRLRAVLGDMKGLVAALRTLHEKALASPTRHLFDGRVGDLREAIEEGEASLAAIEQFPA